MREGERARKGRREGRRKVGRLRQGCEGRLLMKEGGE